MLYMVIEHYKRGAKPVYERLRQGRQLTPGVRYLDSWVVDDSPINRCFQLMEADSHRSLEQWTRAWSDLVEFEILPVLNSNEAARRATS